MERGLIRIEALLKTTQRLKHDRWEITINGERKEVKQRNVCWFTVSFEEAVFSFNHKEIASVNISDPEGCSIK